MKVNRLYRILPEQKTLKAIKEVSFTELNYKERYDIQEWVEKNPEILGEELLIISKELQAFDNTRERPDLVALDKLGNLVLIELKRDEAYASTEWQAIRYASYLSNFKTDDLISIYQDYYNKDADEKLNEEEISQLILDFIDEGDLEDINRRQRIILVAHTFATEVTSAVNWLINEYGMNVKCVQLIPFSDVDKSAQYIHSNILLPLPSDEDLIVRAANKSNRVSSLTTGPVRKDDDITNFFENLKKHLQNRLEPALMPDKTSRWAGVGNNYRYYHFWYNYMPWDNWNMSYKIWRFNESYGNTNRAGRFGIYFEVNLDHLNRKGIEDKKIEKLLNLLKTSFSPFNSAQLNNSYYLEYYTSTNDLSEDNLENLLANVVNLIEVTKKNIDKVLGA